MAHSEILKSLLFTIRQHEAFNELIAAAEKPRLPEYRPSKGDTLETMGAKTVFASGQVDQHNRWLFLLTGNPERETETSQQENP